jgi:hypothetical protein
MAVGAARCAECGRPVDEHDRDIKLTWPDLVLRAPEQEGETWGGDPLLQVDGVGAFVRVLLPIQLTGTYSLTIGTWLAINPAEMPSVWERWPTPSYDDLVLDGYLANGIPPWGDEVLLAPATARVRDPEHVPYIDESTHETLRAVIAQEWPHEPVLAAWASVFSRAN